MCLDKNLEEYIKAQFKSPDHHVYHYTKEYSYCEIIRCEYLKLNSHLFLNDKDDTNHELQISINLIKDKLRENNNNLLNTFEKFIDKGIIYYTVSFSRRRSIDTANKYGNFCIEFCPKLFKNFTQSQRTTLFSNVIYDQNQQKQIIDEIFTIDKQHRNSEQERPFALFEWLSTIIPLLKPYEHRNEEECRVVQAEIFAPETKELLTPLISKKAPFSVTDIINIYKE